ETRVNTVKSSRLPPFGSSCVNTRDLLLSVLLPVSDLLVEPLTPLVLHGVDLVALDGPEYVGRDGGTGDERLPDLRAVSGPADEQHSVEGDVLRVVVDRAVDADAVAGRDFELL